MYLVALDLFDNPLANEPNYRLLCIWTFPSLHVLDRHEVTDEERLAAVKKFGKVSQDLVAFGKRTTKWHNPPPIALASLSATASDMYKELERVRARVEAEEAGKAAREGAAKAEAGEEAGQVLGSKHVRNDYIRVMTWSNPAVEFAAGSSSLQPLQARATATVTADEYASIPAQASSLTITLDQAKYAQCVACAPLVAAHVVCTICHHLLYNHHRPRYLHHHHHHHHQQCYHGYRRCCGLYKAEQSQSLRYEQRKAATNATTLAPVKLHM